VSYVIKAANGSLHGPFTSARAAERWAQKQFSGSTWAIVPVSKP
jgi:hypothetical protein